MQSTDTRAPRPVPADARVAQQRERAERWRAKFETLLHLKRMDMTLLDQVHELLLRGDVPAALDALGARKAARDAAHERREMFRRKREARAEQDS